MPCKLEGNIFLSRLIGHSWNKDCLPCLFSSKKAHLQDPVGISGQDPPASIANSICSIQVLQHHDRTTLLDLQLCKGKGPTVDLIQVLHRIVEHWVIFSCLLRLRKQVHTRKELNSTRKLGKNRLIDLLYPFVHAGMDTLLRKELIRMGTKMDIGIDGVNERITRVVCTVKVIRKGDIERVISELPFSTFHLPDSKVGLLFKVSDVWYVLAKLKHSDVTPQP